jgi:hypothetical protein
VVGESRQPTIAETAATLLGRSEAVLRVVSPPAPHLTQSAIVPFYFQTDGGEAAGGAVRVEPSSDYYGHIWVGDAADLGLALGQVPSARATAALASGGVVSLHSV